MTLVLVNNGEGVLLRNYFNKAAPENKTLRLFKNNITPAETDVAATYTEADFTGYAAKALLPADWTVVEGAPSSAAAAMQEFASSADQTAQTVYGYFVTGTTSGLAQFSEKFAGTPPVIQNLGDKVQVTLNFTAD